MTEMPVTHARPWPLGVTPTGTGVNVAVWAPDADQVEFCVFSGGQGTDGDGADGADTAEQRFVLPHTDGGVRYGHVPGIGVGARYGLRAAGPHDPNHGLRFNPAKLLVDPYARAIESPLRWDPLMGGDAEAPDNDCTADPRDSAPVMPKCIVTPAPGETGGAGDRDRDRGWDGDPDPASNRPHHDAGDLVIYEAHLKGLTAAHPDVPEELRGTYAGLASAPMIAHLNRLGVTTVELLPVQGFIDDRHLVTNNQVNYWGYQPITWFAPEPRYATGQRGENAAAEFRRMVHTLHEAGIEVIVDVVYNHTGEGDEHGPTLSLRGLDNAGYYRLLDGGAVGPGRHYVNDTGTGNTIAADRPQVLRLIMDSLRYWVTELGVDGFRFDLAATLGRGTGGFDPSAAFFQAARQDPVLSGVKLIAEPWDIGPGGYQLGSFPHPWSEWNDSFRDSVRKAWRGDDNGKTDLGSRLLGSAGQFDHSGRPATASVNLVTAHDGFTLADVVSYSRKHNEANGEGNADGHGENFSDNLGEEGPTRDLEILRARVRRYSGILATLFVSQGIPMLLAGDEFGNSQGGNNNAYTQDNPTGWINWDSADSALFDLTCRLIAMRRRMPVLRQKAFLHSRRRDDGHRDVQWWRADGTKPSHDDWHDPQWKTVGVELRGAAGDPVGEALEDAAFVVVNLGGDTEVVLPDAGDGREWALQIDTARAIGTVLGEAVGGAGAEADADADSDGDGDGEASCRAPYPVAAQSVVVFAAVDA